MIKDDTLIVYVRSLIVYVRSLIVYVRSPLLLKAAGVDDAADVVDGDGGLRHVGGDNGGIDDYDAHGARLDGGVLSEAGA